MTVTWQDVETVDDDDDDDDYDHDKFQYGEK
jgi:hypothetical protein